MAKLNKACIRIIEEAMKIRMQHHARIVSRKKVNDPSLPSWFDKPIAWHEAMLEATFVQVEDILQAHNCYKGFRTYTRYGQELRWYFVNGISVPNFSIPETQEEPVCVR
jgi:hypothetical protein